MIMRLHGFTLNYVFYYSTRMRVFKYRIHPNTKQKVLIEKHFGCSRHVYNWALSEKDKHYKETGKSLSKRQIQDRLVASKKDDKE